MSDDYTTMSDDENEEVNKDHSQKEMPPEFDTI